MDNLHSHEPQNDLSSYTSVRDKTFLVLDDEQALFNLFQEIIAEHDAQIILAANEQEILDIFRVNHDKVDCVIMNVVTAEMNEIELFEEMKKIDPDVKALLLCRFHPKLSSVAKFLLHGGLDLTPKPLQVFDFMTKLSLLAGGHG